MVIPGLPFRHLHTAVPDSLCCATNMGSLVGSHVQL